MAKTRKTSAEKSSAYRVKSAEGNRTQRYMPRDREVVATEVKRLTKVIREAQAKGA